MANKVTFFSHFKKDTYGGCLARIRVELERYLREMDTPDFSVLIPGTEYVVDEGTTTCTISVQNQVGVSWRVLVGVIVLQRVSTGREYNEVDILNVEKEEGDLCGCTSLFDEFCLEAV